MILENICSVVSSPDLYSSLILAYYITVDAKNWRIISIQLYLIGYFEQNSPEAHLPFDAILAFDTKSVASLNQIFLWFWPTVIYIL